MQKLNFDLGVKEYEIGGGVLRFNPSDPNVYSRFVEAGEKLVQIEQRLTVKANEYAGEDAGKAVLQIMREADKETKELLSWIFGAQNDFEEIFCGANVLGVGSNASDKVMAYAEDAFYTVGLSANEYMETVTSFSASLISSLGGDTEKAADVANMALVDMADNAAKMGSDLSSIQAAFQGFAKGQYQLLDNLKLGYGGTKTEMERLLKEAQAITGVKYDINNLADVYNAIHVIQEKLDIAGTTAREAEETISGSAAMTASAWKNVLAAISGGGDIDRAINNLVFSLSKYFENIVPVVQRSLEGVGQLIEQVAPMLIETIVASLIQAIPGLISAVRQMIIGAGKGIYQGLTALFSGSSKEVSAQLSEIDASGAENAANNFDAITESANETVEASKKAKKSLAGFDEIQKLGGNKEDRSDEAFASGAPESLPEIELPIDVKPRIDTGWLQNLLKPIQKINFRPLQESFSNLYQSIEPLVSGAFDGLKWAYDNVLVPLAGWTIEDLLPEFLNTLSAALGVLSATIEALKPSWTWLRDNLYKPQAESLGSSLGSGVIGVLSILKSLLSWLGDWISKHPALVSAMAAGIALVIDPVRTLSSAITLLITRWSSVKEVAQTVWANIKRTWGNVSSWFKTHVTEPIGNFFKNMVNGVIGFINTMLSSLGSGINFVVDAMNKLSFDVPDWVPSIGGSSFGFNISRVTVAQIPYLAKGAVLPPNKPFLAVVGDQSHGTNVEAPLATIQEAVAVVMEDMVRSNIAGHEAVVAVLKEILEAVLGIEIGDDVIGDAVARYNSKFAIIRGR